MTFHIIYEPDYTRIIPSILIDARASIPEIRNQVGSIIKSYTDAQVGLLNNESITYKIENELGVLAGFFSIQVNLKNKTASLIIKQFRPAFAQFSGDLSLQISNFIQGGEYKKDYLF